MQVYTRMQRIGGKRAFEHTNIRIKKREILTDGEFHLPIKKKKDIKMNKVSREQNATNALGTKVPSSSFLREQSFRQINPLLAVHV